MLGPAVISQHWGFQPARKLAGRASSPISAALWKVHANEAELGGRADPDTHVVVMVVGGQGRDIYRQDDKLLHDIRLRSGLVHLVPRGVVPRSTVIGIDAEVLHVYLPHCLIGDVAADEGARDICLINRGFRHEPAIASLMGKVVKELRAPGLASAMMLDGLGLQLAVHLRRSFAADQERKQRQLGGLAPWQFRRVIELMQDRIAEDLRLGDLAAELGLSMFHFARVFRDTAGAPPHQFFTGLRIERAQLLLESTTMPVADIAARVGYGAPQAFAAIFKRQTGMTPRQWRQQRDGQMARA